MPSKKRGKGQRGSASDLRKFRSDVAKLKDAGLLSKSVDARSQKPTRHMKEQLRKYSDVLTGKAKAVRVDKAGREKFKRAFAIKGDVVIVPVERGESNLRYNPKSRTITGKREAYGRTSRTSHFPMTRWEDLPEIKRGQVYSVPMGPGYLSFDDKNEMALYMATTSKEYKEWWRYVTIEKYDIGESGEYEE